MLMKRGKLMTMFQLICLVIQGATLQKDLPDLCKNIKCPSSCPEDSSLIPIESHSIKSLPVNQTNNETIRIQTLRKRRQSVVNLKSIIDDYANDKCCKYVCKCNVNNCPEPKCKEFHYLLLVNNFTPTVGQCCQPFECRPKQCLTDDSKILNQGESKLSEHDPCIECRCHDGITRCSTHHCAPLSCLHQIQPAEECCPKCDLSKSTFCLNDENCDRACRHGFIKHTDGCDICQCQPATITKAISTTTTQNDYNDWEIHNITNIPDNSHKTIHNGMLILLFLLAITIVGVVIWLINIGRNRWAPIRLI